ncbi:MAG: hypothetical protein ACJA0H_002097 [Francisellaceae bacterium]|jgi:uncharacterized protein (DUF4415 family)
MNEKQKLIQQSLKNIDSTKDSDIDYTDSQEVSDSIIKNMKPFLIEKKGQISIRLDQEIIDHFKSMGKGYQSKINSVLREYVSHSRHLT